MRSAYANYGKDDLFGAKAAQVSTSKIKLAKEECKERQRNIGQLLIIEKREEDHLTAIEKKEEDSLLGALTICRMSEMVGAMYCKANGKGSVDFITEGKPFLEWLSVFGNTPVSPTAKIIENGETGKDIDISDANTFV